MLQENALAHLYGSNYYRIECIFHQIIQEHLQTQYQGWGQENDQEMDIVEQLR